MTIELSRSLNHSTAGSGGHSHETSIRRHSFGKRVRNKTASNQGTEGISGIVAKKVGESPTLYIFQLRPIDTQKVENIHKMALLSFKKVGESKKRKMKFRGFPTLANFKLLEAPFYGDLRLKVN